MHARQQVGQANNANCGNQTEGSANNQNHASQIYDNIRHHDDSLFEVMARDIM